MQPASKSKTWATQNEDDAEPPTKIQAMEIPEGESDEEYEAVPKIAKNTTPPQPVEPAIVEPPAPLETDKTPANANAPDATDDDWMRSRTNRLLDLMDPTDIAAGTVHVEVMNAPMVDSTTNVPKSVESPVVEVDADIEEEKPDPIIEAIKSNGRLFVRNLPYTATEQDLREHFQQYGSLEEVRP
jgi:multiple RNA-binding domain-containing protein 1